MKLYIEAPVASFPRRFAHDYKETYLFPPIRTIYGCILSLIGELDINAYPLDCIKLGVINSCPEVSSICLSYRNPAYSPGGKHVKTRTNVYPPGVYPSSLYSKPNIKEVVTGTQVVAVIDNTHLANRVKIALVQGCDRFGILSLGESSAMVNVIREYRESDGEILWMNTHQVNPTRGFCLLSSNNLNPY
jgi:CRISPR-associated protein Cas5t